MNFMIHGQPASVEVDFTSGIGRVELESGATIDVEKCCRYFQDLGIACDHIEVYQGHALSIVMRRNPVLGWLAEHRGQC